MRIEDTDIKRLTLEMDRSSNRLAYGMVIAALIIGSALVAFVEGQKRIYGVSILSSIGFAIALMLGIILMISISKEGKG